VAQQLGLLRPGIKVLELGAGTGWLGCTVARNLHPSALVCLTEQEGGLAWLRYNVELNQQRGLPLGGVRVQACDWQQYSSPAAGSGSSAAGSGAGGTSGCGEGGPAAQGGEQQGMQPAQQQDQEQQQGQQQEHQKQQEQRQQQGPATQQFLAGGKEVGQAGQAGVADEGEQGAELDLQGVAWDFIIGSDLIYNEVGGLDRA